MATHTPGPWKAEESRSHAMGDTVWWITADRAIQGEKIAGMGPMSIEDREGCETMAADARLMASAPDLLRALRRAVQGEECVDVAEGACATCHPEEPDPSNWCWVCSARAVIARATGGAA